MNYRERLLLMVFCAIFGLMAGGGLFLFAIRSHGEIRTESENLRRRLGEMREQVEADSEWRIRAEWVEANAPAYGSRQAAQARMLEILQSLAASHDLKITGKEFLESGLTGSDAQDPYAEDIPTTFDRVSVRLTFTAVPERGFFSWMHGLRESGSFLGVTRLMVSPSRQGDQTINGEVDVTQYYWPDTLSTMGGSPVVALPPTGSDPAATTAEVEEN